MRYMEVENHDDYYWFDDDGCVHVWDMRGVSVLYDCSQADLKKLETELLLVASYYMRRVALKERYVPHTLLQCPVAWHVRLHVIIHVCTCDDLRTCAMYT